MLYRYIALLLGSSSVIAGAALNREDLASARLQQRQNGNPTCLAPNALQTASEKTGQEAGTDGIKDGQAPSET